MSLGKLVLDDPQAATKNFPHLTVGLAHADYQGNGSAFQLRAGNGATVTWAHDGNYYQFWTGGAEDGQIHHRQRPSRRLTRSTAFPDERSAR